MAEPENLPIISNVGENVIPGVIHQTTIAISVGTHQPCAVVQDNELGERTESVRAKPGGNPVSTDYCCL